MAGDWIKMRSDLQTHPKVVRIASALNADRLRAVGGLHAVWCLFDAHSVDGSLDGYDLETLDALIGCQGFSKAMASVGWLGVSENSLSLPRFDEHNGRSAKRRANEAERKRAARESADCPQDVRDTSACDADTKRTREEKSKNTNTTAGSRPRAEFPPEFENAWRIYPKRAGDNPKRRALKAWNARRAEGHTPEEMTEGVQRYAQFCRATNKIGTETVKQAATFFGPDKAFAETWRTAPKATGGFVG